MFDIFSKYDDLVLLYMKKFEKLTLAGLRYSRDELFESIIKRRKKLSVLDFRGSPITNISSDIIILHFNPSLEEIILSYTNVTFNKIFELFSMSKLRSLDCFYLRYEEIKSLKKFSTSITCLENKIYVASIRFLTIYHLYRFIFCHRDSSCEIVLILFES